MKELDGEGDGGEDDDVGRRLILMIDWCWCL